MDSTVTAPPTVTEPGLLLRPWTEQDIPALVTAHRDPLMRRWMRHPIMTAEQARRSVEARRADRQADRQAGRAFSVAVLELDADGTAGDPVGGVLIRGLAGDAAAGETVSGETVSGEVGYWVAAHARGRGIAPRALNVVCEWALGLPRSPPLERLELIHSVANQASCRVATKAGFAPSAVIPPLPPEFPDDGHLHLRWPGR